MQKTQAAEADSDGGRTVFGFKSTTEHISFAELAAGALQGISKDGNPVSTAPMTPVNTENGTSSVFCHAARPVFANQYSSPGDDGEEGTSAVDDDPGSREFAPVMCLPETVDKRTGEEDEIVVYRRRAKLFRYDEAQWKERGVGDMKILKHKVSGVYRMLMRREQVYTVACNHNLTCDIKFTPMSTSEVAWCWNAVDFANNKPTLTLFAVKFKDMVQAAEFKSTVDQCQAELLAVRQAGCVDHGPLSGQDTEMQALLGKLRIDTGNDIKPAADAAAVTDTVIGATPEIGTEVEVGAVAIGDVDPGGRKMIRAVRSKKSVEAMVDGKRTAPGTKNKEKPD